MNSLPLRVLRLKVESIANIISTITIIICTVEIMEGIICLKAHLRPKILTHSLSLVHLLPQERHQEELSTSQPWMLLQQLQLSTRTGPITPGVSTESSNTQAIEKNTSTHLQRDTLVPMDLSGKRANTIPLKLWLRKNRKKSTRQLRSGQRTHLISFSINLSGWVKRKTPSKFIQWRTAILTSPHTLREITPSTMLNMTFLMRSSGARRPMSPPLIISTGSSMSKDLTPDFTQELQLLLLHSRNGLNSSQSNQELFQLIQERMPGMMIRLMPPMRMNGKLIFRQLVLIIWTQPRILCQ